MALPKIVQKLFSDEGKGSKLRPDIVPTTINGNSPDSEGNFTPDQTGCLPLSGGTMTAPISTNQNVAFKKTDASGRMQVFSGTSYTDGAHINLNGKDYANGKGEFSLVVTDGTNQKYFSGSPNGTLKWDGKDVITSAGGTFDGNVKFSQNNSSIGRTNTTGAIRIDGGTTYTDGAFVSVHGKEGSQPGCFQVVANDGTNRIELQGKPDGSLKWNGKDVLTSANGLRLSGGTLTGPLSISRDADDASTIQMFTRATVSETPTTQQMRSWRCVDKNNVIVGDFRVVQATSGNTYSQVLARKIINGTQIDATLNVGVKNDGSTYCNFNGNDVITSAGGTMTGTIISNSYPAIRSSNNSGQLVLLGGGTTRADAGAKLILNGTGASSYAGCFIHQAGAPDGIYKQLIGYADGKLTWGGNNVITSAGGTMTGVLRTSNAISKDSDNNYLDIYGSTGHGKGSQLTLFGKGHTNKGQFTLTAHDGTNQKSLVGTADGTLYWNSNRLVTMPNYGAGISIATSTASYTAPSDGYLVLFMHFEELDLALTKIYVNNVYVGGYRNWAGAWSGESIHITLPLSKGDVVKGLLTKTNASIKANVKMFFPMKGA